MLKIILILQAVLLMLAYTNCGGGMQSHNKTISSIEGTNFQTQSAVKECQFMDVLSLSSILKNQLGIDYGDVPIYEDENKILQTEACQNLNPNQNDSNCYYLTTYASTFGVADLSNNVKANKECTSTKYKLATEVFLNACLEASTNPDVDARLFPKGVNDFDSLYLTFIGRKPFSREVEILAELVNTVEPSVAKASACAVVASSFEAVSKL